ncbi:condensation domain-containing protein [Streptomyces scopuliridis]|uniref:Condensation domain-containing protein n=1 Tax=Streptomyces scopuliridis TaxID=452529 RepID=A0ACD4ZCR4_9ACTN|nr:condensation domain-containing protein [Streptomyces scopuliridis]WSB95763.1 condensation domain-containing protein [Streptomyces scopuliridis]WSC10530.1 condensation domain-containing protein [Streptomyces scopuliridis]
MDSLTDSLPIGPLQEGIWLFWQLNPTSPAYSMPEVFHFDGDFDTEAAEFAFNEVIRRHEALRTTFHETDSGVLQVIDRDPEPVPVNVADLRGFSAAAQSEQLQSALDAAANLPFDLTAEPAIRLTAIQVSESRTALVLVAHHIVCDGTSMTIVLDEFGELYRSARRGTPPELKPIAPGYSTFVKRQLAALANGALKEESAYWRERLAGVTGSALPGADRTAARVPGALHTYVVSTPLDDGLTEALSEYARRARSTPFSILLCAMKIMMAAATGDSDEAVGTATSGRTPKFARTVGMLANMVVARSRIDMSRTFAETLEEVSLDLMDAIDHQDLPFSRMVADLHDAGLQPGADVVRTVFSAGANGALKLGEGRLSEVVARTVEGPFDLVVDCDLASSGIALDWEYALRTYSREAADGYCAAYLEILAALLHQPDTTLDSLGLAEILARVAPIPRSDAPSPGAMPPAAQQDRPPDALLTSVEGTVADIWSEVIGVPVQSPHDDFFELGGHSMMAGEAVALVRKKVSRTASLRLLFGHPQLRDFCSRLEADADHASNAVDDSRSPRSVGPT